MGAWGELVFENDDACDWLFELEEADDLSLVESALSAAEEAGDDYLEIDIGCNALAACEVLARLKGNPGYQDESTEVVDQWVAAHPFKPTAELIRRAERVIELVLTEESELYALWEEAGNEGWLQAVEDLRHRLTK
jgi:hypothetical protein